LQHDQPPALGAAIPEPAELLADLEAFDNWVRTIKKQYDQKQ